MRDALLLEDGARVNVLVERSRQSHGLVVLLAGLGGDTLASNGLYAELAQAFAQDADVLRIAFERPPRSITQEVEAIVAAAKGEKPRPVVLVGHSAGGVVAPIAAAACHTAGVGVVGVVTLGAPACRWVDALSFAAAQQLELQGWMGAEWKRELRQARTLYQAVLRAGHTRATLAEWAPRLLESVAARDLTEETLHSAPLAYLRSLDAIDPARAFALAGCTNTQFIGEHDWIVAPEARPDSAIMLLQTDHYLGACENMASSFAAFRAKRAPPIQASALTALAAAVRATVVRPPA